MLSSLFQHTLNVLFPATCIGCGQDGAWLCTACLSASHALTLKHPSPSIDVLYCLGSYDIPLLASAVQRLKYHGGQVIAATLGTELAREFSSHLQSDVIIPVPLHSARERQRGFNQSRLLAHALEKNSQIPCRDLVRRIRHTLPQVTLDEHARQTNVADAFSLATELENVPARGIIVDDVYTTGATISAVARVLRTAGMQHIAAMTVAKG